MACSLCGNNDFETVCTKDSKDRSALDIGMCTVCGLVQQTRLPSELDLSFYYAHTYREDYKGTVVPKPKHVLRSSNDAIDRLRFLAEAGVTSGKMLDIGSGGGEFAYLAGRAGFEAYGLEPDEGYSDHAKRVFGGNFRCGFLGSAEGRFDVITIFHVLEHLPDPLGAFAKLHSLLEPSGHLFVEVPWLEARDASPHNIYFRAHIYYFTVDTLTACASSHFVAEHVYTEGNLRMVFRPRPYPVETMPPDRASVDRLRRRLEKKGWLEYLFRGGGIVRPAQKIRNGIRESKVRSMTSREIADEVLKRSALLKTV